MNTRIIYIDVLRIIAVLGVILLHACHNLQMQGEFTPATDLVLASLQVFTHFAVNIFFLVSGAMTLNYHSNWQTFYRKRLLKIIPPLIFIYLISIPFHAFTGHLWFLYAILAFYALSPIASTWLKKTSQKEIKWLTFIVLILAMISKCLFFITQNVYIFDNDFFSYFALYLLGYSLATNTITLKKPTNIYIYIYIS
jgi:surface polysaccharide O-acyltransferase-like enzyme